MAEARNYTVLGVVGTGGFGKVYRARMTGDGGFTKDVAIKVLHERNPDPDLLGRFRDEARILGLLRDRAIVSVDPPTRLSGRWAVVMDFVDGESAATLLHTLGPFPPGVALEVVGEIARVLDKAYGFEGPEGQPLQLLHRDIKPANIQITPNGEVRLLDFGVARANFIGREAHTTRSISGTPGFIAPERLSGIEGPAGDVFSLGVVLWCLLTGERPGERRQGELEAAAEELGASDPHLRAALDLAVRMRDLDDRERPTHAEVERACRTLRQAAPEPWLSDWAKQVPRKEVERDELAGAMLSETILDAVNLRGRSLGDDTGGFSRTGLLLGTGLMGFSFLGVAAIAGLSAVVLGLVAYVTLMPPRGVSVPNVEPEPVVAAAPVPEPEPVEAAPVEPEPEPAVVEADPIEAEPEPEPVEPEPQPVVTTRPKPVVAPAAVLAPKPPPEPTVARLPISFRSKPWGAEVYVDGARIGATPITGYALPVGSRSVELVFNEQRIRKTIDVGSRSPNQYNWNTDRGSQGWEASFGR